MLLHAIAIPLARFRSIVRPFANLCWLDPQLFSPRELFSLPESRRDYVPNYAPDWRYTREPVVTTGGIRLRERAPDVADTRGRVHGPLTPPHRTVNPCRPYNAGRHGFDDVVRSPFLPPPLSLSLPLLIPLNGDLRPRSLPPPSLARTSALLDDAPRLRAIIAAPPPGDNRAHDSIRIPGFKTKKRWQ